MFLTHQHIFAKELKWLITSERGERTSDSSFFVHSMSVTKDFYLVQEIFRLPWNYFGSKGNWSSFLGNIFQFGVRGKNLSSENQRRRNHLPHQLVNQSFDKSVSYSFSKSIINFFAKTCDCLPFYMRAGGLNEERMRGN